METSQEYQVDLIWKENQNARVSSLIFSNALEVAPHSCLKKLNDDVWSAEHLFIASIESSYMTSFFRIAKNKGILYSGFKSTARAFILISNDLSEITDIMIKPTVVILQKNQLNKALKVLTICKDYCLVINALKVRVHIFPSVIVA